MKSGFLKDWGEYSWETETRKPAAPARMRALSQSRSAKAPMVPHTFAERKTLSCSINCASSSGWFEGRLIIPITVSHTWASVQLLNAGERISRSPLLTSVSKALSASY